MTKVKMSEFDLEEMRWNCEMARLWIQGHFDQYKYSEYKRNKEAEWHIDFAILVFDEAEKRMKDPNYGRGTNILAKLVSKTLKRYSPNGYCGTQEIWK